MSNVSRTFVTLFSWVGVRYMNLSMYFVLELDELMYQLFVPKCGQTLPRYLHILSLPWGSACEQINSDEHTRAVSTYTRR